jgi:hypothetical protein
MPHTSTYNPSDVDSTTNRYILSNYKTLGTKRIMPETNQSSTARAMRKFFKCFDLFDSFSQRRVCDTRTWELQRSD